MSDTSIGGIFRLQKETHFKRMRQTTADERIARLRKLRALIVERRTALQEAIHKDYGKSPAEVDLSEVYSTLVEIDFAIKHLRKWMRPVRVGNPLLMFGSRSELYYEAKGVVLVIGPWNYPFSLLMIPLISAISAGCCVMLKPSELATHTSAFLVQLIRDACDPSEVALFEGGADVVQELLKLPFDHVFFTGSTRVGRIVMEAAARNLTPVTLELGGKSPAIIDASADLATAARRIIWGKCFNAGQTCVAPDYVLVPRALESAWLEQARQAIAECYGLTPEAREQSPDLCRIINDANVARLKKLLDESVARGARVAEGGQINPATRYVAPTLVTGLDWDSPLMQEEIFGPILPVLPYDGLDEVYPRLSGPQGREKPLALYVFASDRARTEQILAHTTAGGTCVNTTLLHLANPNLPFGGIGGSGTGSYHGYFGFKTFSHERAVLKWGMFDVAKRLFPPYRKRTRQLIDLSVKHFT